MLVCAGSRGVDKSRWTPSEGDLLGQLHKAMVSLQRTAEVNLAQRWIAILDAESDGDAEILSSLMAAWSDWAHWPATLRWRMEGLAMLSGESFDLSTEFVVRAMETQNREHTLIFSEESFEQDVLRATEPVLVSIWTDGCTGCARLAPMVDSIARELKGRVKVGKLAVEPRISEARPEGINLR